MSDLTDEETGSSNISKASPEWKAILERAKIEHRDCSPIRSDCQYTIHHAYRLVNEQVTAGTHWTKCTNCGSPFIVTASAEICSDECGTEYGDYLSGAWGADEDEEWD